MIDNPECAVCGATQWLTLAEHKHIEVDYNQTRRHNANGYLSPEVFEAQQVA